MTRSPRSTWPEVAYALALMKPGHLPAQRAVLELFAAHAQAQGVFDGSVICSGRDLSSHLHKDDEHGSAGLYALRGLEARGILRCVARGSGSAPSEYDVAHWTRWTGVAWKVRPEVAVDRLAAFAASQIRAQFTASARVLWVRALTKSARSVSDDLAALARESMDSRANSSTAPIKSLVGASQFARKAPAPSFFPSDRDHSLGSEGASSDQRGDELLAAITFDGQRCWGSLEKRARYLAAECNGRLPELVALARTLGDVRTVSGRISVLEEAMRRPAAAVLYGSGSAPRPSAAALRRRQLESDARALELAGELEEAAAMRHQLSTLGTCDGETV